MKAINIYSGSKQYNKNRLKAITHVSWHQPEPAVKNWRILLQQSCTAHMPLLMATSAFGSGRSSLYHIHKDYNKKYYASKM